MDVRYFPISSGANCYLVKTENAAVVIDPFEADSRVVDFFTENADSDKYILLTHFHFDHILGAYELSQRFSAKIIIGEEDECGLSDPMLSLSGFLGLEQTPFSADVTVSEGDVLDLGGTEFRVMHTPGHTAGSVCYLAEEVIFTGDTLFRGSIGRTDFPTGDPALMMDSLQRLKEIGKDLTVYSGHGEPTTLFNEMKTNPYLF